MDLSTSSSRTEWKVILLAVSVLLAGEAFIRLAGHAISNELWQLRGMPQMIREDAQSNRFWVVVLGNSLALCGMDRPLIQQGIQTHTDPPARITYVVFQGSFAFEWNRIIHHYFLDENQLPDVVIMPFNGMQDQVHVNIGRTVYHCAFKDLPAVTDRLPPGQTGEFLHSYFSSSFANRSRVRQILLERLLPDYRQSQMRINAVLLSRKSAPAPAKTYLYFREMMAQLRERGVSVWMLAMPNRDPYTVEPEVLSIIQECGGKFIDMRQTPGLTAAEFRDRVHLNDQGAKIFSTAFTQQLLRELPSENRRHEVHVKTDP